MHISVGDLLREEASRPSVDHDIQIKNIMSNASLVPYDHVRDALDLCLLKHMQNGRSCFLIDGFPRSGEQARFFDGRESIPYARILGKRRIIVVAGLETKGNS